MERFKTIMMSAMLFPGLLAVESVHGFVRIDGEATVVQISNSSDPAADPYVAGLIRDLEKITGLRLCVKNGYVRVLSDSTSSGFQETVPLLYRTQAEGSATARTLFLGALQSENVYKIRGGRDAQLGRVFKGDLIELDFLDSKYLRFRGVPEETFNTAMIFFHELVHRHLHLPDPSLSEIRKNRNAKGPTVEFMNRIERELGLPERVHYFPQKNPVHGTTGFCIFFGDGGRRIEIDAEMFRPVYQSGKNQGYIGLLRK